MALDEGVVGIQLQGTETLYIRRAENRHASHQQLQKTSALEAGATKLSARGLTFVTIQLCPCAGSGGL